ncbi:MAG: hypothetical protein J6J66_06310 [Clostridia bacterium]|nr:hypothetical protein [Clostridia bacterium]
MNIKEKIFPTPLSLTLAGGAVKLSGVRAEESAAYALSAFLRAAEGSGLAACDTGNVCLVSDEGIGNPEGYAIEAAADALFAGTFYCSTGAAIDEMYIEDGTLYVKTPPVREIRVFTGARYAKWLHGTREMPVTELCFDLTDPRCRYFRVTVTDFDGGCAYSNAYYPAALGVTAREKP